MSPLMALLWRGFRVAERRHAFFARFLDYFDRRRAWWALLIGQAALNVSLRVAEGDALDGVITAAITTTALLCFYATRPRDAETAPSTLLVAAISWYEVFILAYVALTIVALVFAVAGAVPGSTFLGCLARVVCTMTYSYLAVDLCLPPRERKRVRVPRLSLRLSPSAA